MSDSDVATERMIAAMNARPSGDADADFVAAMIPHHQAAIEMAREELRRGRNEQLRRLAQEIIVTQQQEIVMMRLAIGQSLPSADGSSPSASASTTAMPHRSTRIHEED